MAKFKILNELPSEKLYVRENLPNLNKKGKPCYICDYGIWVEVCPFCKEYAYEKTHCVFCGAEFEELTNEETKYYRELNDEKIIVCKNITVKQVSNGVYVFRDNAMIQHLTTFKPLSNKELFEIAKQHAKEE